MQNYPQDTEAATALFDSHINIGAQLEALAMVPLLQELSVFTRDYQEKAINLYIWNDRPRTAFKFLKKLCIDVCSDENEARTWQLARALSYHEEVKHFILKIRKKRSLDLSETKALIMNYLYLGDVDNTLIEVEKSIQIFPEDRELYVLAFQTYSSNLQLENAIEKLYELKKNFGLSTKEVIVLANLHWSLRNTSTAYADVLDHTQIEDEFAKEYWLLRTELALLEAEFNDAQLSWIEAAKHPVSIENYDLFQSVIEISYEVKNYNQHAHIAEMGYYLFNKNSLLIEALRYFVYAADWQNAKRIVTLIEESDSDISEEAIYYFLLARIAEADGDIILASEQWEYAVSVAPEDINIAISWMWFLISHANNFFEELILAMKYYEEKMIELEPFIPVFAYGYAQIKQYDQSLFWFQAGYPKHQDWQWLLGMAQTYDKVGLHLEAYHLRKNVYYLLKTKLNESGSKLSQDSANTRLSLAYEREFIETMSAFLSLQREFSGPLRAWDQLEASVLNYSDHPEFWHTTLPNQLLGYSLSHDAYPVATKLRNLYQVHQHQPSEDLQLAYAMHTGNISDVNSLLMQTKSLAFPERVKANQYVGLEKLSFAMDTNINKLSNHSVFNQKAIDGLTHKYRKKLLISYDQKMLSNINTKSINFSNHWSSNQFDYQIGVAQYEATFTSLSADAVELPTHQQIRAYFNIQSTNDFPILNKPFEAKFGFVDSDQYDYFMSEFRLGLLKSARTEINLETSHHSLPNQSEIFKSIATHNQMKLALKYQVDTRLLINAAYTQQKMDLIDNAPLGENDQYEFKAQYRLLNSSLELDSFLNLRGSTYQWYQSASVINERVTRLAEHAIFYRGFNFFDQLPEDSFSSWFGIVASESSHGPSAFVKESKNWLMQLGLGYDWQADSMLWHLEHQMNWALFADTQLGLSMQAIRNSINRESQWSARLFLIQNL